MPFYHGPYSLLLSTRHGHILVVVNQLCIFYEVQEGNEEIGCDGSSALRTALARDPILTSDPPDYDIIGAI